MVKGMEREHADASRVLSRKRESKRVEFKSAVDINKLSDFCELVKDIVAMANSGGGVIVFGVDNKGKPVESDISSILDIDPAKITDKIARYTSMQFDSFEIMDAEKEGKKLAIMTVGACGVPMVFISSGAYTTDEGKEKSAFQTGTLYVRHGAKSEPCTPQDVAEIIQREIDRKRKELLRDVRKVVSAPIGSKVIVEKSLTKLSTEKDAVPVRIVDSASAKPVALMDPNQSHPYRQKEVLGIINTGLGNHMKVNSFDLFCVRKVQRLEEDPNLFYKPKYSSPQYSPAFVERVLAEIKRDPELFEKAKRQFKEST